MSSPETRDFQTFELTDPVTKLAGGIIPEIAEAIEFPLRANPSSPELGIIAEEFTPEDGQSDDSTPKIELETAVDLVERSGIQEQLNYRSLWTPEIRAPLGGIPMIMTSGIANEMDRTTGVVMAGQNPPVSRKEQNVYIVAGKRQMESATEVTNKNVKKYKKASGRYPEERAYALQFTVPRIQTEDVKLRPILATYEEANGDKLAERFAGDFTELFSGGSRFVFAGVANAGIQLAAQFRKAIRARNGMYDYDHEDPQVFIVTDNFPIAKSKTQLGKPKQFQSPFAALKQVILSAKYIREIQEEWTR